MSQIYIIIFCFHGSKIIIENLLFTKEANFACAGHTMIRLLQGQEEDSRR
jgi:hypothetical protein